MFKKVALRIRNHFAQKKHTTNRKTVSFTKANKIGILIEDIPQNNKIINKFVAEFEEAGKSVEVLCYTKGKNIKKGKTQKSKYKFKHHFITSKDIRWNGKFKSKLIDKFIKTDFDYLFSLNTSPFLPFENILIKSQAKCRIGSFHHKKENYYEFMIHDSNRKNLSSLTEQMIFFTKKIEE